MFSTNCTLSTFYCECLFVLQAFHRLGTFHPLPRVCRQSVIAAATGNLNVVITVQACWLAWCSPVWLPSSPGRSYLFAPLLWWHRHLFPPLKWMLSSALFFRYLSGLSPCTLPRVSPPSRPAVRSPGETGWWFCSCMFSRDNKKTIQALQRTSAASPRRAPPPPTLWPRSPWIGQR